MPTPDPYAAIYAALNTADQVIAAHEAAKASGDGPNPSGEGPRVLGYSTNMPGVPGDYAYRMGALDPQYSTGAYGYREAAKFLQGNRTSNLGTADPRLEANARTTQDRLIQQMQNIARGGDSPAMQAQRDAFNNARGQAMSLASNQRNVGAGAALRGGRQQQDLLTTQQGPQAALLQAQQQQAAQQALQALYQQQRQQDLALADMTGQGRLKNQSLNDSFLTGVIKGGLGYEMGGWEQDMDQARATLGFDLESQSMLQSLTQQMLGAGAGAVGTAASMWGDDK